MSTDLRLLAVRLLQDGTVSAPDLAAVDLDALLHELHVYHVELSIQKAELEAAQAESERARQECAQLFQYAPAGLLFLDRKGTVRQLNQTAARKFAATAPLLVGKPFAALLVGDCQAQFFRHLARVLGEESRCEFECRCGRVGGGQFPATVTLEWWAMSAPGDPVVAVAVRDQTPVVAAAEANRLAAESEERFQVTFEAAPVGIAHVAPDGRWLRVNQRLCDITGYDRTELAARSFQDITHPDDLAADLEQVERMLAGALNTYSLEKRYIRKDGRTVWVSLTVSLIRGPGGDPKYFISIVEDISGRRAADAALRLGEERLRLAIDAGRMGTFDWDMLGGRLVWSHWHEHLWGYRPGEFGGRYEDFSGRVHPDDLAAVEEAVQRCVRARERFAREFRVVWPDGSTHWVAASGEFAFAPDGAPVRMRGVVYDIDDRKRAEEALEVRERAIAAAAEGMVIADALAPDRPLIYVSPGFERLTGYQAGEVLGRNCRFLQGPDTDRAAVRRLREALNAGEAFRGELLNYRRDGSTFWNDLSLSPVRDGAGRVTHYVGVQADVTDRRRLEEQFRQSQKMEAIGQLAGGVAHDFNNLLVVINGYSEMLLETAGLEPEARELLEQVRTAGERSAGLTRQLLAFSRRQVVAPRDVDLSALVGDSEKLLRRLIGEDVALSTRLAPAAGTVRADPGQLEQILFNLAVNARDAMPTGGLLSIETSTVSLPQPPLRTPPGLAPGAYAVVTVSDTGCGMTGEVMARIFEPFFTTKGPGKGTGLGLATVYGIVKAFGGAVDVESVVGAGTTFRVFLPSLGPAGAAPAPGSGCRTPPRGHGTVLLVEDESAVRELTRRVLAGCGYTVLTAADGAEALRLAAGRDVPPDLLVTDVVMPGLGGREVAERLRERHPALRVLYLSGYTDDAVVRYGLQRDEVDLLQKPFTPYGLSVKVREVLSRPPR